MLNSCGASVLHRVGEVVILHDVEPNSQVGFGLLLVTATPFLGSKYE
jgi:hypothetical protein